MTKYSYSVEVDSGLKPAGENDFPLVQAKDVAVDENGTRLNVKLAEIQKIIPLFQEEYDRLVAEGKIEPDALYLIKMEG